MNKRIKTLWLKALRSGKYKQGRKALAIRDKKNNTTTFCCLGVLCDLHAKALKDKNAWLEGGNYIASGNKINLAYGNDEGELPMDVQNWAGLDDTNPEVSYKVGKGTDLFQLSELNDRKKLTFKQIAKLIEKSL